MTTTTRLEARGFGATLRRDAWWVAPLASFVVLSAFVVYSTWAAFQGEHYAFGPYLSPFYSPEIFGTSEHAWFGPKPPAWPGWLPFSPAFLILWAPAGFRLTCYYYRKAYYRSFGLHPAACGVGESHRGKYRGETGLFVFQNLHRYFLYFALLILVFLWQDVWKALWFDAPGGGKTFGVGVGTLVLAANTTFLTFYTFSCHSLRHLVGGNVDCYSCVRFGEVRRRAFLGLSRLNEHHMLWAWMSLFAVGFADAYVRLCSMGVFRDARLL